jgi:predicted RNA binding protein YcfA (HicA-like mRNA interferase family)
MFKPEAGILNDVDTIIPNKKIGEFRPDDFNARNITFPEAKRVLERCGFVKVRNKTHDIYEHPLFSDSRIVLTRSKDRMTRIMAQEFIATVCRISYYIRMNNKGYKSPDLN